MVKLSTPVTVPVPVGVGGDVWISHEAESSCHPAGTTSLRSIVVVAVYEICCTEPLPLIVQVLTAGLPAEGSDALNTKSVLSSGLATLTIVRNPAFGVITQSDGSEFGSCDG